MSTGRSFLLIDELDLLSAEVSRPRRARHSGEVPGLTTAQKQVWTALHFLLHRREHGYREGYCSYAEIAEHCGLCASTVVEAVKALVAAGLLLKRRRRDARGKRGPAPFYAPNAYWLLPPPSVRTAAQQTFVQELSALWGEDEKLPPRRPRSVPPAPAPAPPAIVPDRAPPRSDPAEDEDRRNARALVREFHQTLGHGPRCAPQELELARGLIARHGIEGARSLAAHVIQHDKPRSFMLLQYHEARVTKAQAQAASRSVVSAALGVRIEALQARWEAMLQLVLDPEASEARRALIAEVYQLDGVSRTENACDSAAGAERVTDGFARDIAAMEARIQAC